MRGVVCGGQHEHLGARLRQLVKARLNGHVLLGIPVGAVLVGELVHVVKQEDGGGFFGRLLELLLDDLHEFAVRLVFSTHNGSASACLDKAASHERFAYPRLAVQQHGPRRARAKLPIRVGVGKNVGGAFEPLLHCGVPDDLVECSHVDSFRQ